MKSLKERRLKIGLTQKEVADKMGVDQSSVHCWETGKTIPRAAHLIRLAELYNCTIDELFREHS